MSHLFHACFMTSPAVPNLICVVIYIHQIKSIAQSPYCNLRNRIETAYFARLHITPTAAGTLIELSCCSRYDLTC
jgi:hypothetical protein